MRKLFIIIFAGLIFSACSHVPKPEQSKLNLAAPAPSTSQPAQNQQLPPDTMPSSESNKPAAKSAVIKTSLGDIAVTLFADQAPITVSNFADLAEGSKPWTNPTTGQEANEPLYDNTIFHRVIPDFMIQGGDPLGNGTGGPGYKFADEIVASLTFDKPYLLAMANSGPATNGSQFFITVAATPWLNGKHTIFGEVTSGQDIVDKIVSVPAGASDKPATDVIIKTIEITR